MYDYLYRDFNKPQYIFLGFLGLINTHIISTIITLVICLIMIMFGIKKSIKNIKNLVKLVVLAVIVLLISSYFWMPMLEQLYFQKFKLSNPWKTASDDTYTLFNYLGNWKYSIGFSVSIALLLLLYGILTNKISKESKIFFGYFVGISVFLLSPIIWKRLSYFLNFLQFKWRLISILTVIITLSISLAYRDYLKDSSDKKNKKILIISFIILFLLTIYNYHFEDTIDFKMDEKFVYANIYSGTQSLGIGAEYMPIELQDAYSLYKINPNSAYTSTNYTIDDEIKGVKYPNLNFIFNNSGIDQKEITIPFVYYYGYVANITTKEGETYPIEVSKDKNGLVKIQIPKNLEGEIRVWYNGTKIQKISLIISVVSIISTIVGLFIIKRRKR